MNVAVFLGAQTPANPSYIDQVVEVARIIGKKGHTLVFGGSGSGTMAVLAKAANEAGVKIIGVVPEIFRDLVDKNNDVIEYVPNMGIRKERMAALGDVYVILPGGFGTLEEMADVISWKRMGIVTPKTIVINYKGFYEPTRDQINRMIKEGYIKETVWEDITFIDEAKDLEGLL